MADLAMGATACVSFWRSLEFKAAVVMVNSIFLLGDAVGHVRQMIVAGNFAPGNAGVPFFGDLALPRAGDHSPDYRSAVPGGGANLLVAQNTITLRNAAPEREEASASLMLEPIAAADQFVELEASLAIELDDLRHVDRQAAPSPS